MLTIFLDYSAVAIYFKLLKINIKNDLVSHLLLICGGLCHAVH